MAECSTCQNEQRLAALEKSDGRFLTELQNLDNKLDVVLSKLSRIEVLENSHNHHAAALDRAFQKLTDLETQQNSFALFKSKTEGMASMAWIIWTVIGGGLAMLAIKVLFFLGQHGVTG